MNWKLCFSIYITGGNSYVEVPTREIKIWFKFWLNITEGDCVCQMNSSFFKIQAPAKEFLRNSKEQLKTIIE